MAWSVSYSAGLTFTDLFNRADVNPLDNGWLQVDPTNQKFCQIVGGRAFGTATAPASPPPYNDANAYRTGFGNDFEVEGVIYKAAGIATSPNMEVEILLRWHEGPMASRPFGTSSAYGYEININQNGDYLILNDFLSAAEITRAGSPPAVANGDRFRARVVGSSIKVYWNDVLKIDWTDTTYPVGNPGIGFYVDNGGSTTSFGFESVTIRAL